MADIRGTNTLAFYSDLYETAKKKSCTGTRVLQMKSLQEIHTGRLEEKERKSLPVDWAGSFKAEFGLKEGQFQDEILTGLICVKDGFYRLWFL